MINDPKILDLLCCPICRDRLAINNIYEHSPDGHILEGELRCSGCTTTFPIIRGVPRFITTYIDDDVSRTIDGFGFEWQQANPYIRDTRFTSTEVFLDFIHPIKPDYFEGKVVMDAGCGSGRFTLLAQKFGAKSVVGVDLSESVETAFKNTRYFPNVVIIQADLLSPLPVKTIFDYVFSVGVLHHTADPYGAFKSIASLVKVGGGISAWVYGRENNEWIIYGLNPIRLMVTSRLPRRVLLLLSYVVTVPLFFITKFIHLVVGNSNRLANLKKYIFYFDYLYFIGRFGFHEQARAIVFDHLVPTIAQYISYTDFRDWFIDSGFPNPVISQRNHNSWRGFGTREPRGEDVQ